MVKPQALAALMLCLFQATSMNNSTATESQRRVDVLEQPRCLSIVFKDATPTHDRIFPVLLGKMHMLDRTEKAFSS